MDVNSEETIGEKLVRLRNQQGLTLQQLADATDLSVSFLSQLERNKVNVSVANLKKVATALNITMAAFFSSTQTASKGLVTRADERHQLNLAETGWQIEALLPEAASRLEAFMVRVAPGSSDNTAYPHQGEEFSLVLQGHIRYIVEDEAHDLGPGDTIFHKSKSPHQWKNTGEEEAIVLTVTTPSGF